MVSASEHIIPAVAGLAIIVQYELELILLYKKTVKNLMQRYRKLYSDH